MRMYAANAIRLFARYEDLLAVSQSDSVGSDGDGGFLIVLRLGCSVSGSQAQVWIDCPTDEQKERKRKRTPRTTTIPSWASCSCRLKTAVLDGVTVFQFPTPART